MRISILSESAADEAAVKVLVDAILETRTELVPKFPLRQRGWPSVKAVAPAVIKSLHYRTDTDALVIVVDSNESNVHPWQAIGQSCAEEFHCRLCELRKIVDDEVKKLSPVHGRKPPRIALGLAVPAIEAWYLSGSDMQVTEAAWINGMISDRLPYTKRDLKQRAYGTERPSLDLETERAVDHASRVSRDIEGHKNRFPSGFGWLWNDVKTW